MWTQTLLLLLARTYVLTCVHIRCVVHVYDAEKRAAAVAVAADAAAAAAATDADAAHRRVVRKTRFTCSLIILL